MSIARRIVAAYILAAATAGGCLAAPPVGPPPSPTPDVALVRVTGTITTVDDDFDCDPQETIEFSRLISVHSQAIPTSRSW